MENLRNNIWNIILLVGGSFFLVFTTQSFDAFNYDIKSKNELIDNQKFIIDSLKTVYLIQQNDLVASLRSGSTDTIFLREKENRNHEIINKLNGINNTIRQLQIKADCLWMAPSKVIENIVTDTLVKTDTIYVDKVIVLEDSILHINLESHIKKNSKPKNFQLRLDTVQYYRYVQYNLHITNLLEKKIDLVYISNLEKIQGAELSPGSVFYHGGFRRFLAKLNLVKRVKPLEVLKLGILIDKTEISEDSSVITINLNDWLFKLEPIVNTNRSNL